MILSCLDGNTILCLCGGDWDWLCLCICGWVMGELAAVWQRYTEQGALGITVIPRLGLAWLGFSEAFCLTADEFTRYVLWLWSPDWKQSPQQDSKFFMWILLCACTRFSLWTYLGVMRHDWGRSLELVRVACGCLAGFGWGEAPESFFGGAQNQFYLFFLSTYYLHLGTCSHQACREGSDLVTSLCLVCLDFLHARVTVKAGTSWKLGYTSLSIYCCCSVSLMNWECEGRSKGNRWILGFYV